MSLENKFILGLFCIVFVVISVFGIFAFSIKEKESIGPFHTALVVSDYDTKKPIKKYTARVVRSKKKVTCDNKWGVCVIDVTSRDRVIVKANGYGGGIMFEMGKNGRVPRKLIHVVMRKFPED